MATKLQCDGVGDSLPQLTDLLKVQGLQVQSLEEKHKKYKMLQDIIQKEKTTRAKLKDDIQKLTRKLRLLNEQKEQLTSECKTKEIELQQLVTKIHQLQKSLKKLQQERADDVIVATEYNNKMSAYIKKLSDNVEMQHGQEIIQGKIQSLLKDREVSDVKNMSNKLEEVNEQLVNTIQHKQMIIEDNNKMSTEITEMEVFINDLKSEVAIARKRNHAQLTRLRHQLQETQGKRYHWQQDKERLTMTINKMKKLSEE